jgi:16S rRNA (uracil1498-N3)-methyltransferase
VGDADLAAIDAVSLPRFVVDSEVLSAARVVLTGTQLQHLRARRLRVGSKLVLADGVGTQRHGVVTAIGRHQAVILLTDEQPLQRDSALRLTLAQALLKGDKLDWVVEKTTELGAAELVLFTSERTVGHAGAARQARWTRVARSAAQQCQRSTLPLIIGPIPLDQVLARDGEMLRLFFWEQEAPGSLAAVQRQHPQVSSVLAMVGPEGGFSPREAAQAAAAGFQLVGLAPRILRAETAAVAAATLCQFLWGDLGENAGRPVSLR